METCSKGLGKCEENFVLTVPMRNGNNIPLYDRNIAILGSYRTYEEWKLLSQPVKVTHPDDGSYRTYEEWKPWLNRY